MSSWLAGFKLDLRSLALGRILIGSILVVEFLLCILNRHHYYTEQSILPRAELVKVRDPETLSSLYFLATWPGIYWLLLITSVLVALAFTLGYRSRLSSVLMWILVISIQERNPLILIGGDSWLRATLFWLMFLPLGEYFSIDQRLRGKSLENEPDQKTHVADAASFGLVMQVCFVYWYAGTAKYGPDWWDGNALYYILQSKEFGYGLAERLLYYPEVLSWITVLVPGLEILAALFLIVPYRNSVFRLLGLTSLMLMHFGIWTCLELRHFSAVAIAILCLLLPSLVWSRRNQTERFWGNPFQTWLSVFLVANTLAVLAYNGFRVAKAEAVPVRLSLAADLLGLEQRWQLFAPDAPSEAFIVYAVAELTDGSIQPLSFWGEKRSTPPEIEDDEFEVRLSRFWRSLYECSPSESQVRLKVYATWFENEWIRRYPDELEKLRAIRLYHKIYPTSPNYEDTPAHPPGLAFEKLR